jgi:hypothetical protein
MVRTNFSGREIAAVLIDHGFVRTGREGSHLKLCYESPDTADVPTDVMLLYTQIQHKAWLKRSPHLRKRRSISE